MKSSQPASFAKGKSDPNGDSNDFEQSLMDQSVAATAMTVQSSAFQVLEMSEGDISSEEDIMDFESATDSEEDDL